MCQYEERFLKSGDLVWLIDESVRRHENEMVRVIEKFPGAECVSRPASIKTAKEVLRRSAMETEPVFFECLQDENKAADVGLNGLRNN